MSNKLINDMRSMQLPPIYKQVLWTICDIADDNGNTFSYAPLSRLVDETCLGRDSVIRALAWLELVNLVSANRENGRKTTYRITLENADIDSISSEFLRKKSASSRAMSHTKPVDHSVEPVDRIDQSTPSTSRPQRKTSTPRLLVSYPQPVDHSVEPVDHSVPPVDATDTNHIIHIIQEQKQNIRESISKPDEIDQQVWDDFLKLRKSKKAPLTKTALNGIIRESKKAGWTIQQAITECLERGWQGFKSDWVKPKFHTFGSSNEVQPMRDVTPQHGAIEYDDPNELY